ncbi:MAG: NADH-quinone oxidoreductase subunit C [Thermodesulfobacteriota bacterium]|jgi:NADH-quinone oxidoreductase subunit C
MGEANVVVKKLKEKFPSSILDVTTFRGEVTVTAKREILQICEFLYSDPDLQYHLLTDLTGLDFLPQTPRFGIVYLLCSLKHNQRLRLKVRIGENESIPSVASIWRVANWYEREVYDLFGIFFENHPDLRRILLWDGFEGYPLRKDYPVEGPDFDMPFIPEV